MIDEAYVPVELQIYTYMYTVFNIQNYVSYFANSQKVPSIGFLLPQTYIFFILYC